MLWYVLQSIDVSASPTTVSACGASSTLSTTAYFKLFTKNEDNTTSASTNTSETVTASASYSENKSYTSVSGSKITFDKNKAGDCYGADSRNSTATASYTFSGVTKTDTVTITQNANPLGSWYNTTQTTNSISISPASMSFDSAGGTQTYSVTRNYTQYEARQDSCGTVVCTNSYNTSSTVKPSDYDTTGDFECTSSSVSIDVNSGSERTGKLTVSYDGKSDSISLSQGASQAGTSSGEPYDYTYDFSVSVSPWNNLSCDGGTTYATATLTTSWKYDWEETNDAGEVIDSGTASDSSSSDVTNSTTWSTDRGSISSNGTLTYPASTSSGTVKTTVTGVYGSYSDSDYMTQVDCSSGGGTDSGGTSCMTIYYTLSNGAACTVYFKTTNGTQQGSHYVDATGSQSLCNIAPGTELVVSCSDTAVTIGGDTQFTYTDDSSASISLTKSGGGGNPDSGTTTPTCMSYMIGNNTSESVTIRVYTINGNYDESRTVQGDTTTDPYEICDLTEGTKINVSKTSGEGELNISSFNFKGGDEVVIEVSEIDTPTCTASNSWTGISVTNVSAGKCDTSASMTVTASGTHKYTDCSTATTSTTLTSSNYTVKYGKSSGSYTLDNITANETTSEVTWYYKVTASSTYGSKTATGSFTQDAGPCPDACTCSVTSISVSPTAYTFTSSTDSKSFDVTINDNSSTCSKCNGGFKVYDSNGLEVASGTTSFSMINTGGTFTIKANDDTSKTATVTLTKYTAPATCDCSTVSISVDPTKSTTTGGSVSTTVTVTGGTNCATTWKAYSDSTGELLGSGANGKTLSRTATGSVTFRADACTAKTATWTISEPTCYKPTVKLVGSSSDYSVGTFENSNYEWCPPNDVSVNIDVQATFIGESHNSPVTFTLTINSAQVDLQSIQNDSTGGDGFTLEYSEFSGFGATFTITPNIESVVTANCYLSGTFLYNTTSTPSKGTFNITISFGG